MKTILTLLIMLVMTGIAGCDSKHEGSSALALSETDRRTKVEEDLALIRRYNEGLQQTLVYAKSHPEFFPSDEGIELSSTQKHELRRIFQTLLDYMRALDGIKSYWRDFHRFGVLKQRRAHAEAFFVGYSAWLTQYRFGLDFIDLTVPSKVMEKLLDEGSTAYDIPQGAFGRLKWNIIHVKAIARLLGSQQYFKTIEPALVDAECEADAICAWTLTTSAVNGAAAKAALADRGVIQFSYNTFDIARDFTFENWFPLQKNVAEWLGDTKVHRLHHDLISEEDLKGVAQVTQPGDILVARHNWYLSNVGLPGFWPHALLWLGSPEELDAYFDDAETRKGLQETYGLASLKAVLKARTGVAWQAYNAGDDMGHALRIVEAVSEGVVFSSMEHGAGADYVGVMRPLRSKLDKARAIIRAFERFGKPYDFNFDFVTDETLVCTELVYKAWHLEPASDGLDFDLINVMGRQTLPANELVRQFDEGFDSPNRQLDFVYFVDGREKESRAEVGDVTAFRASWKRPKWDVLQE